MTQNIDHLVVFCLLCFVQCCSALLYHNSEKFDRCHAFYWTLLDKSWATEHLFCIQRCSIIIWKSASGSKQNEQLEVDDMPHLLRLLRCGSVLFNNSCSNHAYQRWPRITRLCSVAKMQPWSSVLFNKSSSTFDHDATEHYWKTGNIDQQMFSVIQWNFQCVRLWIYWFCIKRKHVMSHTIRRLSQSGKLLWCNWANAMMTSFQNTYQYESKTCNSQEDKNR